jgi:type II secretory pathway pseudopilin PulG
VTRFVKHSRPRGFTLIEAAIVTAIVGLGIVGLLELIAAGSMANIESAEATTAVYLAENVNEMMQGATYATIKSSYDNVTYTTPKDGRGQDLAGFSGWSQVIDVSYVDPNLITSAVPDTQVEDVAMVTVKVVHSSKTLYTLKWLVAAPS